MPDNAPVPGTLNRRRRTALRSNGPGALTAAIAAVAVALVFTSASPGASTQTAVASPAVSERNAVVAPAPQSDTFPSPCAITTTERIVAIGDIHGGYDRLVSIMREAGIIDSRDRWSAGRTILVQTGDVVDRGPGSRRALDLLQRLETEAAKAGGAVHALLGNHEVMRMMRDLRDVSAEEYAEFRGVESQALRDRYYEAVSEAEAQTAGRKFDERAFRRLFLQQIPLGFVEMQIAFEAAGRYGQWLRGHDTMVRINDVVFVHGGISRNVAALGCEAVNNTVRDELRNMKALDDPTLATTLSAGSDGPLWYRGLALDDSPVRAADVDDILSTLGARTIVIGHTTTPGFQIRQRFNGRVVQIDTGLLNGRIFPGGRASALEIHNGVFTAIYEGRPRVVFERGAE